MVLPCILITLVALLGFYIPSDSGEKVTMGITTLLSMTVFMMLVAENMPPTSDVLPLIGLYYGITICIVSTATGMTVLTLNIHHKGHRGREVPRVVKTICLGLLAKLFCMNIHPSPPQSNTTYAPDLSGRGSPYIRFRMSNQNEMEQNANETSAMDFRSVQSIGKVKVKLESEGKKRNGDD
ncbi:hypothetical protein ScPMuIL_016263 [Solemya velum]